MKIQVVSDLHLEVREFRHFKRNVDADILVLAGDLASPSDHDRLRTLLRNASGGPIVMVAGNHDYYADTFSGHQLAILAAEFKDVTLLRNSAVEIDGVTFVGGTLWSDFLIYGEAKRSAGMSLAQRSIRDFISIAVEKNIGEYRGVLPSDMIAEHKRCVEAIEVLATKRTVMVTHFLPLVESIAPKYAMDPLNCYFASDCSKLIERVKPVLAVHGHTHTQCDYMYGPTRVVCNPRGYSKGENELFDPSFSVEI